MMMMMMMMITYNYVHNDGELENFWLIIWQLSRGRDGQMHYFTLKWGCKEEHRINQSLVNYVHKDGELENFKDLDIMWVRRQGALWYTNSIFLLEDNLWGVRKNIRFWQTKAWYSLRYVVVPSKGSWARFWPTDGFKGWRLHIPYNNLGYFSVKTLNISIYISPRIWILPRYTWTLLVPTTHAQS